MRSFLPCTLLVLAVGSAASLAAVEIVLEDRYLLEGTKVTLKGDLYYLEQRQGTLIVPAKLVREVRGLETELDVASPPVTEPAVEIDVGHAPAPMVTAAEPLPVTAIEEPAAPEQVAEVEPDAPAVETQEGLAAWYGRRFHGRRTASGEAFDMNALTAAHASLPFGAVVSVTNLENGIKVKLRINDRLPSRRGLALNVSRAAAETLGMLDRGKSRVRIEIVER